MAISLFLIIVTLLILPLDAQTDFRVKLRHIDSGANLTKFELLRRALKRDEKRLQNLYPMALLAASRYSNIESPIYAGEGEFLTDLSIGTPPKPYVAILDTGSDLVWTQCNPCKHCYTRPTIFDPSKSRSFSKLPCTNLLCTALPKWLRSCGPGNKSCEYLYPYGDTSSTRGFIATETFGIGKVSVRKIGFGCGINNTGGGFHQADGLVGLGRGPLSLVSQLNVTVFSYCLPSVVNSNKNGTLLMGFDQKCAASKDNTTPLIKNTIYTPYYYLSLEGITVGATKLPINKSTFAIKSDWSGGMIIDSGTTITYVVDSAFDLIKEEFIKQVKIPVACADVSSEIGLDLCFEPPPSKADHITFPDLIFHFQGLDLALPQDNYILGVEPGDPSGVYYCLMMGGSASSGPLSLSIFGNFMQQGMQVVHDLKGETLTFVPKTCEH